MNGRHCCLWMLLVLITGPLSASAQPWTAQEKDWPNWRGPEQNGISREKGLPDSMDPQGKDLKWALPELASRSTPIVMDRKLYVIKNDDRGTRKEREKVVCADAETGRILWENSFNVFLSDVPNTRVGWSSVVGDPATGNVFALGVCGIFRCIDADGRTVWEHSLSEEYGILSNSGGRTNIPVVHEDMVIISGVMIGWGDMATPTHRFIAFDKRNGQPVWINGTQPLPHDTTYSTPIIARLNGQTALVFGSGDGGIHALQLRTGKKIWSYNVSKRGINTTPVVASNGVVICGHSEENIDSDTKGALFAIDGNKTGEIDKADGVLWKKSGWTVGKTAPLIVDGRVYSVGDYGNMRVNDLETGQEIYSMKIGTQGRSSPLYADGKIYICEANGRGFVLKPTADGMEELESFRLRREKVFGSPIVSHGRIYLPTTKHLYCFEKSETEAFIDPDPRPVPPPEFDDRGEGPAYLQLVPVETLLRPGQKQPFQTRLYSKNGLYIKTVPPKEVEYKLLGPGEITEDFRFTSDGSEPYSASIVQATYGELTNLARVRVVPNLPWKVDFSNGQIPIAWVGFREVHAPIDYDFLEQLKTENPTAAQLYLYLQSGMVNSDKGSVTYGETTPHRSLTDLYSFLGIDDQVTNMEDAMKLLSPGLDKLVEEQFLSQYGWTIDTEKHVVFSTERGNRRDSGNIVVMKINTIPQAARSQAWLGHTDFENYTTQVDVLGAIKEGKLPDIGVIAQRYRLELLGDSQELRLYSWIAHDQKFTSKKFEWKPDVWYTMKLSASYTQKDGESVATLKGKIWPRDQAEPEEWTITWDDAPANETGSPGLFGNAKAAEIFYDNIVVTPNAN